MKKSDTPKKTAGSGDKKKEEPSKPVKKTTKSVTPAPSKPEKRLKEETDEFEEFRIDDADFGESTGSHGFDDEEDDNY